jgi:hypothetical protein
MRFDMTHVTLEFHRGRPKWFLRLWYVRHKPCTYLASRLALSSSGLNWASLEPSHLGLPSCASKTISVPVVRSAQTVHLSCVKISTISNELSQASTWASSPRSTIGCDQNDFWAYDMFSQTVHLSCTDTSTLPKWTKTRFHMTDVSLEFHRVRPKWFLRLWNVRHKSCTYLVSRWAISLNGLARPSNLALSPRSTIGCVQIDF